MNAQRRKGNELVCHQGLGLLFVLLLPTLSPAQKPVTAAEVTASGRTLGRALDLILGGPRRGEPVIRNLIFLIDPTPTLQSVDFADLLETALAKHQKSLVKTRIGLALVGGKGSISLSPPGSHEAILLRLSGSLTKPHQDIQNVYTHIRRTASSLSGVPGRRDLVLVSLDNGDAEDNLEGTVKALARAGVTFSAITTESHLADSYWASGGYGQAPPGCRLKGGDQPYIDLPWGWIFQSTVANRVTPSGFAQYGINRLAFATKGRVYLFTPPAKSRHVCTVAGACPFCTGDHLPKGEQFIEVSVHHFAPLVLSRKETLRAVGNDPYFRALFKAWKQAAKAGLLRSKPPMQEAGSGFKENRNQRGQWASLGTSMNFERQAQKAIKLARTCSQIIDRLEKNCQRSATYKQTLPRFRAMAELTLVQLNITRINILAFAAWCRETAPAMYADKFEELDLPEIAPNPLDQKPSGINYTGLPLCHGVAPFQELHLPGGEEFKKELKGLEGVVAGFLDRYSGTPYAMAVRLSNIAKFHFFYPGRYAGVVRDKRNTKSKKDPGTATAHRRPPRRPAVDPGRPITGPTSGGR